MRRLLLPLGIIVLFTACGDPGYQRPPRKKSSGEAPRKLLDEFGRPAVGSETDPSRNPTHGEATIIQDTWLLHRKTDRLNYIRVKLLPSPKKGDMDTFTKRCQEGRYQEITQGTKVLRRGVASHRMLENGVTYQFVRIEVTDGSLVDENGDPMRGSVIQSAISN